MNSDLAAETQISLFGTMCPYFRHKGMYSFRENKICAKFVVTTLIKPL